MTNTFLNRVSAERRVLTTVNRCFSGVEELTGLSSPDIASGAVMIAQLIGFTGIFLIERRTGVYGRLKENYLWNQGASEGASNLVQYPG
nr:hypothetical protein [uncultured Halomonas sp.]